MSHLVLATLINLAIPLAAQGQAPPGTLENQLRQEPTKVLARDARSIGDARRGAAIFHQPNLTCARCHVSEAGNPPLGPELAAMGKVDDEYLVESILDPSKVIKKGYETISVSTEDGQTIAGLLAAEGADRLSLRDPTRDGKIVTIDKTRIELRKDGGASLMPSGLAAILRTRQEFLDLVRYLIEIAEGGAARASALKPNPAQRASQPQPLPDSERAIDHAGLIADSGKESFARGEAIYQRVCMNCHGNREHVGSLPTSLRFAIGTFKNGADPFAMYRTLTLGFGQMTPQTWMVPRQKYDVIHYIREAYLRPHNPTQYARLDKDYLASLPKGKDRGPAAVDVEPWVTMDYGPYLLGTYEISAGDGSNIVEKGIAVRLDPGPGGVSRGKAWVVYDEDTMRFAAAWTGQGFIDWNGINFNGRHQVHPRIAGNPVIANPDWPGWSNPLNGTSMKWLDQREIGRDGGRYGPLPRRWLHYKGLYNHGNQVVLNYTVGHAEILETPGLDTDPARPGQAIFSRNLDIGKSPHDLRMLVAPENTAVALAGDCRGKVSLIARDGVTLLNVPAAATPLRVKLLMSNGDPSPLIAHANNLAPAADIRPLIKGSPRRWPEVMTTRASIGRDEGPFAVDLLTVPERNPWLCLMRLSGFDFMPDGRSAAVCTWDGDVWMVEGLDAPSKGLSWRRIASGLFQPLGLKVKDGRIYVSCRDQIVLLNDLDGDGETDLYENFNNDHQVTEHFHEFAMDLETDEQGNYYYTKAARHGLPALVPQHGTLLKVSKDGARTEVLATGFRAPNGVCLNRDGTFFLSDQEGFWLPKNRINWVRRGGFYGNIWGYTNVTDPSDSAMEPPLCWITNAFDRSPAQLLHADSVDPKWRPLQGALLCLSYGYGKIFVVPHEKVAGQMQGGEFALPIPRFPTGVMRARFHPRSGDLYACGLFAWAGDQTQPGGFYRVRATGKPMFVPIGLKAREDGIELTFTDPMDATTAAESTRYAAKTWSLKRSVNYGSEHHDEHPAPITSASVSPDGRTVFLKIPGIHPTWCMEIRYNIRGRGGKPVEGLIHNTIHHLGEKAVASPAKDSASAPGSKSR